MTDGVLVEALAEEEGQMADPSSPSQAEGILREEVCRAEWGQPHTPGAQRPGEAWSEFIPGKGRAPPVIPGAPLLTGGAFPVLSGHPGVKTRGPTRRTHSSLVPSPTPETEYLSQKVALLFPVALGTRAAGRSRR